MSTLTRSDRLGERAEKQRQKELQRQLKEMAKLDEQQRGRLEVESFENELAVLLSVHKQSSDPIDWMALAFSLPPHAPAFASTKHLRVFLQTAFVTGQDQNTDQLLQSAWSQDEEDYWAACAKYEREYIEWARLKFLGQRILARDTSAYSEVISEFSAFGEIANLGASVEFKAHDSSSVQCALVVNGQNVIPSEMKTLTGTGKLSVKTMPKARFHEIYQDYVCGCCLRIAREILALLPVSVVLVTITVASVDSASGHPVDSPVLSVFLDRQTIESLNFEFLDPSDSMANFNCRGDVRVSKKTGEFATIIPYAFEKSDPFDLGAPNLDHLMAKISSLHAAFRKALKPVKSLAQDTSAIYDQLTA